jgi:hypothetical protein
VIARAWLGRGRPRHDGPREFVISTSIGRLRVAECTLCGALVVQDDGQLQHIRHHAATDTLGVSGAGRTPSPPRRRTTGECRIAFGLPADIATAAVVLSFDRLHSLALVCGFGLQLHHSCIGPVRAGR